MKKISKEFYEIPEELPEYAYLNTILNDKMDKGEDFLPAGPKLW